MGLFSPWFLAGFVAIGLPLYLHLLQQHKTTPVPFASLRFFEKRTQSSIKHRRLRHLLLLALRLALLILLALAFAEPFLQRNLGAGDGNRAWMIVVDDSFSMRAASRLDEAKRAALALLGRRKPGTETQVAALGSQLRLLTQPEQEDAKLRAAIESIRGGDTLGSYAELTRALRSIAQSMRQPLDVHLFTDAQKSALPVGFNDLQLPENVSLHVHPVADKPEPNWAVESVSAPAALWDTKKARIQATVAGYGSPSARRTVSLLAAGKVLATKAVDVPENGRASVEFQGLDVPYGFARCEIRIDGADKLAQDDRFLFAVQRSDPRPVLFVHESRDSRSSLYFRAALAASAEAAFSIDAVASEQTAHQDPSRFAFVVLSDVLSLPGAFENALQKYVRGGGSVLIAAGPSTARHGKIPVAGWKVAETKYFSRGGERFAVVGDADLAHPALRRAGKWEGVKFYYVVKIDGGQARIAARLADQTPLVLDAKVGEGRVMAFASSFDNNTNDLPLAPVFVPFVERSARYLAGLEDRSGAVRVNANLELRSAREQAVSVEVIDPDGNRPLSLQESTKSQFYQFGREGYFEVRRANGRHEMVAVNADRKESDLNVIPQETIELWTGSGAGVNGTVANGLDPEKKETKPSSLGWYFLAVLAAVVAAESLLASRYLGVQREERVS